MLHEEIHEPALLGLLQAVDLRDEFAVDEEAFLTRDRVHPDQRMHGVDWVLADETPR